MIQTIKINNLTLGTLASGYIFSNFTGFAFPSVRVDIKDRGSFHGADLGSYLYGRRVLGIELEIIGEDKNDYELKRRALEKACDLRNGLIPLTINTKSGLVLQNSAIVSANIEMPYKKGNIIISEARIELTIPFPFFRGRTTKSETIWLWSGGGFGIPFEIPIYMSEGASVTSEIDNEGNTLAYPIITINGALENPVIVNDTTDQQMSLTYNLTNGNYITIDSYNRTVLLNGTTNIRQYIAGDWLYLATGSNSIRLSATSFDSDGNIVVSYKDTYLGI